MMPGGRVARAAFVTIAVLAVAFALRGGVAHHAAAAGDCTVDASLDSEEKAFLTLINNYRQQNGLPKLAVSYTLTRAAAWKSADMANNNYFAHDDLSRTWVQRIRDCGYGFNTYIGENIAAGYTTAQAVFDGWKNSPGHNANMLGANYTAIGIGRYYRQGSPYGWYWTTDFGGFDDGWMSIAGPPAPVSLTTPSPAWTPAPAATPTAAARADDGRRRGRNWRWGAWRR